MTLDHVSVDILDVVSLNTPPDLSRTISEEKKPRGITLATASEAAKLKSEIWFTFWARIVVYGRRFGGTCTLLGGRSLKILGRCHVLATIYFSGRFYACI